jgi:hypothetical protein
MLAELELREAEAAHRRATALAAARGLLDGFVGVEETLGDVMEEARAARPSAPEPILDGEVAELREAAKKAEPGSDDDDDDTRVFQGISISR